jgi:hypothetical protein
MTHIENIPHILQNGITHSKSKNANPSFFPIGDNSIINLRNEFKLDNGKLLGEYIPFYFGIRTPMLYVIQKGYNKVLPTPAEKIVYCVTSVQKIIDQKLDFVFTDGHAVDGFSSQYTLAEIPNINTILDKNAIDSIYWKNEKDLDLKRKKEAEFLILNDIPIETILGFITYNENAKNKVINFGVEDLKVIIRPNYYF